ncbi:MAG TPA: ribosome biogenesis GTPase Der [Acidimicrobiales bacterium]|nr:ribosome biogenesis GTPase Der [Acidimicrobiales bacterium]
MTGSWPPDVGVPDGGRTGNGASGRDRPVVAVVGRPNVGKSTLVNRIVGRRETIVEEQPGVTRDRKVLEAEWAGREFDLVDTGGWQTGGMAIDKLVSGQAQRAISEAEVIVFVVDATVGPTPEDEDVARLLLRSRRPVVLVVNKVDNAAREADIWSFSQLGFTQPWPVSALHGRGTGDMLDAVVAALPSPGRSVADEPAVPVPGALAEAGAGAAAPISVAIVGRPNVGKSSLFNRIIGDERAIVHDLPGTTRDSIDTVVETPDGPVRFVDTAGMRRHGKEADGAEYYSMVRALQAIDRASLALLVIDASEGVTRQDQRLAERVDAAGNPVVVVLNKWDLLDAEAKERARTQADAMLGFVGYAPRLELSAKTGRNVHRLYPALAAATDAYSKRVPTASLNRALAEAQAAQPAPHGARVLYATQGATDPPTFTLFTSKQLPATYIRYLERSIREGFGFGPTPLKLRVRRRAS